ncbi:MAG TPA: alpha/beta fold hydrolase, partial [Acidimicrobiia bacterium]|nr:alpha/beta fold hydrolase [Acidimicrobiia bacterium]
MSPASPATPASIEMVAIGGVTLRVSVQGLDGAGPRPPLLLCNGIGAPIELWPPFRDRLARPTIAFDAPGVGESAVPLFPPTMAGVARLVLGLLDHLGVGTVDVLGVSWGGALAQELAHRGA